MEIKDYVAALAGRGRVVAAVAVTVGLFAMLVFILQPQRYSATATVVLPVPPSTTTSALAAVSEAYADFSGALTTEVVAESAATDVGVPTSGVDGHVSASRLSSGSIAEVTYSGTDGDHAVAIAKAASQEALAVVIAARLAPLDQQLLLAQTAYDDANTEYQQFVAETGIYSATYFTEQQRRITHLQDELGVARVNGDTEKAAELQGRIDTKNATISQNLADYQRITSTRSSALEAYQTVQQSELSEKGLLQSAQAGGQVSAKDEPRAASRLAGLIKAVLPAVVVATGLAIAMIVLLEVVGPVRIPMPWRWGGENGDDEGDGGDDGAHDDENAGGANEPEAAEPEAAEPDPAGRKAHTTA